MNLTDIIPIPPISGNELPGPHSYVRFVTDIHGHADELIRSNWSLDRRLMKESPPGSTIYEIYGGDYCDRGPDTRGVIEHIMERRVRAENGTLLPGRQVIQKCLMGNHDAIMMAALESDAGLVWRDVGDDKEWHWFGPQDVGGEATLKSYGLDPINPQWREKFKKQFPAHVAFLNELLPYYIVGQNLFVHAGIDFRKGLNGQTLHDFVSVREGFLEDPGTANEFPYHVVHGHTISFKKDPRGYRVPDERAFRTGVDTGMGKSEINPNNRFGLTAMLLKDGRPHFRSEYPSALVQQYAL